MFWGHRVIAQRPAREKPIPRTPSSPELWYVIASRGSTPARPGTVTKGMLYVASPVGVTEKLPGMVPAGAVIGPGDAVVLASVRRWHVPGPGGMTIGEGPEDLHAPGPSTQ